MLRLPHLPWEEEPVETDRDLALFRSPLETPGPTLSVRVLVSGGLGSGAGVGPGVLVHQNLLNRRDSG